MSNRILESKSLAWMKAWRPMKDLPPVAMIDSVVEYGQWFFTAHETPVICYFECDDKSASLMEFMEEYKAKSSDKHSSRDSLRYALIGRVRQSREAGEVCLTQMRGADGPRHMRYLVHRRATGGKADSTIAT